MKDLFRQLFLQASRRVSPQVRKTIRGFGSSIPTAINPFTTRTPTTIAGNVGKLLNPLNPANLGMLAAGQAISSLVPADNPLKGNLELLSFTPGGVPGKLGTALLFGAVPVASGTLDAAAAEFSTNPAIRPRGERIGKRNQQGQYWAGENWGYQSPESFNQLYGTNLSTRQAASPSIAGIGTQAAAPSSPVLSDPVARAENQERSRISQLTEQDPLLKKYQVAELSKAYNAASPEEKERIGLQIWATTNPRLAQRVPPGQVGYMTSAAMSGTQVFGSDFPGITQTSYQQASEKANNIPFTGINTPDMNAYGLGANVQQIGVSSPGGAPIPMLGKDVFNKRFDIPSSEDLSQTQLALLKRAFENRLK